MWPYPLVFTFHTCLCCVYLYISYYIFILFEFFHVQYCSIFINLCLFRPKLSLLVFLLYFFSYIELLKEPDGDCFCICCASDNKPSWILGDVSSDAGSLNGDEVDRAAAAVAAAPQTCSAAAGPGGDLLSPTGSCSSLGGVPRCLSPVASDPFPSGSSLLSNGSHISGSLSSLDSDASGSTVTSNDSHPAAQRGAYPHAGLHHDTPRARRLEAEARKAEKRSRVRSPERHQRPSVLSPERSVEPDRGWGLGADADTDVGGAGGK